MELQLEPKLSIFSRISKHSEFIIVGILVAFYLFFSNYYYWSATFVNGGGILALPTSGGSDPFYNFVVILHILTYHSQLVFDPTLNYPFGTTNPRNPFFHWFIVLVAEVLSPFMNTKMAAFYAFEEFNAVFGALLIIPVYLITREVFGKNAGAVGALLYTLMPSNLSAGILSGGRMHTPELLFAFFAIYFFLKAVKLSQKVRIIDDLMDIKSYPRKIINFFNANRIPSIYALLAGASLGGLMLAWQGYAYIEAILLLYVAIQLIVNLILKRPTGYLTMYTAFFVILGFLMGAYYYQAIGEGPGWYNAEVLVGIVIVLFGIVIGIIGRRPWILIIPLLIVAVLATLEGMAHLSPALLQRLLSGEGYFIKTRVYDTIAEAAAPQLGAYIGGFGVAQFILGMTGIAYAVYLYLKEKSDELLYILIFSLISIYMSFAAARFNITAAPAYAILGAGMLVFFARVSKVEEIRKRKPSTSTSPLKAIRGNVKGLQAVFVILIVALLVVPSATFMVSASVPYGSTSQVQVEQQIASSIPSFLQSNNTTNFVGGLSSGVTNGSTPLSQSLAWLSTQDANLPIVDKPAYLSWWDYGFQERYQGQHPTVADDFQQAVPTAGQTLLAQNQSQIVSLFMARILQAEYQNGHYPANVTSTLSQYLGNSELHSLLSVTQNPSQYTETVLSNPSIYGQYIQQVTTQNVYLAFVKGDLASKYPLNTLVNLYQNIIQETGYNIKYIQVPTDNSVATLFPTSGTSTGIFYAPAYLTDSPSYTTSSGGIIPTEYYQIYATTTNGTFALNNLPTGVAPTGLSIQYTSAFYNTSIYRIVLGFPPSAVGQVNGIPGIDFGSTQYTAMPAWNMSNFLVVYENIPFNPYTDYAAHANAWTTIPLQQAYYYKQHNIGTVELFPSVSTLLAISDPIVAYYSGAIVQGRVTLPNGAPVAGVHVTIFDQYGIPHQVVQTNSNGYYNITALPGNDTLYFSQGSLNQQYLVGSTSLGTTSLHITKDQANRIATSYNSTTGKPDYYITENQVLAQTSATGTVSYSLLNYPNQASGSGTSSNPVSNVTQVKSGNLVLTNQTEGVSYNLTVTNGKFSQDNVQPMQYNVSLYSQGHLYSNFANISISLGSTSVSHNLIVPFDVLYVNLTAQGNPISGLKMGAQTTNGYVFQSEASNSTGVAKIWFTPGNYSFYVSSANVSSAPLSAGFDAWGLNRSVTLQPEISAGVSVNVLNAGANTTVSFFLNGIANERFTAAQSGSGYGVSLPYGVYTLYAQDQGNSYIQTLVVNGTASINVTLEPSANLRLTSYLTGKPAYSGAYEIISGNNFIQWQYTLNHTYDIQLPEGPYTISGYGTTSGIEYSGLVQASLFGNTPVNMTLQYQNVQSVLIYAGNIAPAYSSISAVNHGFVVLKYLGQPIYFEPVSTTGSAQLYYPDYSGSQMSLSYESAYYASASTGISSSNQILRTDALLENSQLQLNSSSQLQNTQVVHLISSSREYNYTLSNGASGINVEIGLYHVSFTQSNSTLNATKSYLEITSTHKPLYVVAVQQYANITVKGAAAAYLFADNGTPYTSLNYVPLGNYQLYAYNSSIGVSITNITVASNNDVFIPFFGPSAVVTISNSQGVNTGNYTITFPGHTLRIQGGLIALPSGRTYGISYMAKVSNSTGSFMVSGSSQIAPTSNTTLTVPVTSQEYYSTLSGTVYTSSGVSSYARVAFLDENGNYITSTNSNYAGQYSMKVPTGAHFVYITNSNSMLAYLGSITVPGFTQTVQFNATLKSAYYATVTVNMGSQIISNDVKVSTSSSNYYEFNSSIGKVLLPVDNYTFESSVNSNEMAVNGTSISVTYSQGSSIYLHSNTYIPLSLQKVKVQAYQVNLKSPKATLSKGESVIYNFTLTNIGNSKENLTFAAASSQWGAVFNQSYAVLSPGQAINLSVNVTLVGNVPYGSSQIPIYVNYTGGSTEQYLPVNVAEQPSYSVAQNGVPSYYDNITLIPVLVNNTGNAQITVNLSLNYTYLGLHGWHGSIVMNNKTVQSLTLQFGQSEIVYVQLMPNNTNPVFPLSFTLNANSSIANGSSAIQISMQSPSTANVSPYPTGVNILANYTGSPTGSLLIGIAIIVVAVVAGLAVTAYRGRKK